MLLFEYQMSVIARVGGAMLCTSFSPSGAEELTAVAMILQESW